MKYFTPSRGVLGLATNSGGLRWPFDSTSSPVSASEFEACRVKLTVNIGARPRAVPSDLRYHSFTAASNGTAVHYGKRLGPGIDLSMTVDGLGSGSVEVSANRAFVRLIHHRMMNLHSLPYVLSDIACMELLLEGFAPLHCSAAATTDGAHLIYGAPNVGKTYTALRSCEELKLPFMAEDIAITDGRTIHAVPWTSTFRYYRAYDRRTALGRWLRKAIPALDAVPWGDRDSIKDVLPGVTIRHSAPISRIIILARGPDRSREISPDQAFHLLSNLNRFEFKYPSSPLLNAWDFMLPGGGMRRAVGQEVAILRQLIESAGEVLLISRSDASAYFEAIWKG